MHHVTGNLTCDQVAMDKNGGPTPSVWFVTVAIARVHARKAATSEDIISSRRVYPYWASAQSDDCAVHIEVYMRVQCERWDPPSMSWFISHLIIVPSTMGGSYPSYVCQFRELGDPTLCEYPTCTNATTNLVPAPEGTLSLYRATWVSQGFYWPDRLHAKREGVRTPMPGGPRGRLNSLGSQVQG